MSGFHCLEMVKSFHWKLKKWANKLKTSRGSLKEIELFSEQHMVFWFKTNFLWNAFNHCNDHDETSQAYSKLFKAKSRFSFKNSEMSSWNEFFFEHEILRWCWKELIWLICFKMWAIGTVEIALLAAGFLSKISFLNFRHSERIFQVGNS